MNLSLNSLSQDLFKSNGQNKIGTLSRDDIVAVGRIITKEYNGCETNKLRKNNEYQRILQNDSEYAQLSQKHKQNKLLYCAACAYAVQGKEAPTDYNQVMNDARLSKDPIFLATMAGIDTDIITPLLPAVISDAGGLLMQTTTVPLGQTKEITVHSNDIFLFEDSSWGAGRSSQKNYLYDNTVTLIPTPRQANATIKWFQLVANDTDIGWYYNSIMSGMYSKIMALYTSAMQAMVDDVKYIPDYLKFTSYTSENWANAVVGVQAANNLPREQLAAYGDYRALSKVLPQGTASDAALTYGLGLEWVKRGFLGEVGGVPLFEVTNALVPGTVNTTGQFVYPAHTIIIAGRPGAAYAPIYTAFAEGSPMTIEMNPSQTANYTIDISVTAVMDTKVVMGSKISAITGVV